MVEYGICYLIMQLLNLSMLSFRLVLITVIQCYTTFQGAVFRRDHIIEVLIDLYWLKIKEKMVYEILIFSFKAFIDRTAPLYLCELIEQQKSTTNTRLAGDAFLLKLPPPSRNCADTYFERSFLYGAPYEWNTLDERVRRLADFNNLCLTLKSKPCYFYVILIISMLSLLADYNSMVIFKTFTFMFHYID